MPERDDDIAIAAACGAVLGEGPVWDRRLGAVLWVDIGAPAIWRLDADAAEATAITMPEAVGFVALTPDPDVVVAGLRGRLAAVDLIDKTIRDLAPVEPALPGNRCNDGIVAPDGTLWFSTMDTGEAAPTGAFHAWDGRAVTTLCDGFVVPNGPALSPDGDTLYTTDTTGKQIHARRLVRDPSGTRADTRAGAARLFADLGDEAGVPDGVAVDEEGVLWVAMHGAGRLLRIGPDGRRLGVVMLPTPDVTKPAFGGRDLSMLYVTSAARARPDDPMAGHLYRVPTRSRGLPANVFPLEPGAPFSSGPEGNR